MKTDIQVVVMAGGSGTRFWPLSRRSRPKQFLPIVSRKSMIEETVGRLRPLVSLSRIHTVANFEQTRLIRQLIPGLPEENCLVEPQGKNTAPSLILATAFICIKNPEAAVVVLPADHLITDTPVFLRQLEAGAEAAAMDERLITFGIPPVFPATGYGYLHTAREASCSLKNFAFYDVLEFKEKPTAEQARAFLEEGDYYWNSGMFIWRPAVFAAKLKESAPEFHPYWVRMVEALKAKDSGRIAVLFEDMPALSIDFALMEKARGVLVCPARFGWSDVGAWSSLLDIWPKDSLGNAGQGELVAIDAAGNLVHNPGKLTALIGVEDLIVVETDDALLVCRKDQDQKVKDVLERLKKDGRKSLL